MELFKKIFPTKTLPPVWKEIPVTPKEMERAAAAYKKISAEGYVISKDFNADNAFTDSLLLLNCFTSGQRKFFMSLCRGLARDCAHEREFTDKNRKGCLYGYVSDRYKKSDLSVMKDLSPEDYPSFLAVCSVCKSGYVREEALRLAGDYPTLAPVIIGGFNDNVPQVRAAAEKAFDRALNSLETTVTQAPKDSPERYTSLAVIYRTRHRLAEIAECGRFSPAAFSAAENRLDKIIAHNMDEETVNYLANCHIFLAVGWFNCFDRLAAYRGVIKKELVNYGTVKYIINHDYWARDKIYFMASSMKNLSQEELRELAFCSQSHARRNAATRLFDKYGLWDDSERLLTDPDAPVRETAVYYYQKLSHMDLYEFYLSRLPEIPAALGLALCSDTPPRRTAAAKELRTLLPSSDTRTASAALCAITRLDPNAEEIYGFIKDPRPRISKTALKLFLKTGDIIDPKRVYGDITEYLSHNTPEGNLIAARLTSALLRQPVTTAKLLPYAIRLCAADCERVSMQSENFANSAINNANSLYTVTAGIKADLQAALDSIKTQGFRPKTRGFYEKAELMI
ncbi:MAG: hypothetical protein NC078_10775 [Ruminococcus sp.]|nr:hypothetical protein [Ruminococcus sp.]